MTVCVCGSTIRYVSTAHRIGRSQRTLSQYRILHIKLVAAYTTPLPLTVYLTRTAAYSISVRREQQHTLRQYRKARRG
eukprot:2976599-Rhodomonas_salina.1